MMGVPGLQTEVCAGYEPEIALIYTAADTVSVLHRTECCLWMRSLLCISNDNGTSVRFSAKASMLLLSQTSFEIFQRDWSQIPGLGLSVLTGMSTAQRPNLQLISETASFQNVLFKFLF